MTPPNVIAVGAWHPDSVLRWLADGFVYAGCRVVRVGPQVFGQYPNDELPPAYTLGLFDTTEHEGLDVVLQRPFSWRKLQREVMDRSLNAFTAQLILYDPFAAVPSDTPFSGTRIVRCPGEDLFAYDPHVHRVLPEKRDAVRDGCLDIDTEPVVPSIRAHVQLLNGYSGAKAAAATRRGAEAVACGVALTLASAAAPPTLRTYHEVACELLEQHGYDYALPRLWQ